MSFLLFKALGIKFQKKNFLIEDKKYKHVVSYEMHDSLGHYNLLWLEFVFTPKMEFWM